MRKILSSVSVVLLFVFTSVAWTSIPTQIEAAPESIVEKKFERIDLPEVSPARAHELNKKSKSLNAKPVQNLSKEQLEMLEKLGPGTSVSSYGKIVTKEEQDRYLKKHKPELESIPRANEFKESESLKKRVQVQATDNRKRINPTTYFPYNAVANLEIRAQDGSWYACSGWYMDKNTVVTAAHCVYDNYDKEWSDFAFVTPARNGGTGEPYGWTYATDFHVTGEWINAKPSKKGYLNYGDVKHDYAVINVVDNHSKWFSIRYSNHKNGESVNSTGYPGDKGYYFMYSSLGKITQLDTTEKVINHNCYVTGGMSGGPIFTSNDGDTTAIGINSTASWSPQLTKSHYDRLKYWAGLN